MPPHCPTRKFAVNPWQCPDVNLFNQRRAPCMATIPWFRVVQPSCLDDCQAILSMPAKSRRGEAHGVVWRLPAYNIVHNILTNPIYAGADGVRLWPDYV